MEGHNRKLYHTIRGKGHTATRLAEMLIRPVVLDSVTRAPPSLLVRKFACLQ